MIDFITKWASIITNCDNFDVLQRRIIITKKWCRFFELRSGTSNTCFFYKQSKFRKQAGACLWKKLVQAQSMLALCLFIKFLLGVCLQKRLDQV